MILAFAIFEDTLYSPCNGTVSEAVDTFPDLIPPESDRKNLAGNYILMQCQGVGMVLAHLQKGSLLVQDGDNIQLGRRSPKLATQVTPVNPTYTSMPVEQIQAHPL